MSLLVFIGFAVAALVAIFAVRAAKRSGNRALALSNYAQSLSLEQAKFVHDLAVATLGTKFQAVASDQMKDIEIATATRDRVDEIEGKSHGPLNKASIRMQIAQAVRSSSRPFRYRFEPTPEQEDLWADHYTMMGRIFLIGENAPNLPKRS